ncbi:MAG: PHP domain-containing protein [Deltaproteobacteria bacterium]|nr:PHP domain-containing protein [Deltaproteobacteria bacterium]
MSYADFHLHTYFSDGLISPNDLAAKLFRDQGLDYFALTDHDSMSGIEPFFRAINRFKEAGHLLKKRFIPGIELSLLNEATGLSIHLIGLFPYVTEKNYKEQLRRIDLVLGDFCRYRSENRAVKDLDARVKRAYEINLEGIADRFDSPETIIKLLRNKAKEKSVIRFHQNEKDGDVIQHPIPATYQILIDHWEELLPSSSKDKATLYVLRPDRPKTEQLAGIYISEGMSPSEALQLAEQHQGTLVRFSNPVLKELTVPEGLSLLKKARAVTILAHPAVDHNKVSYDDFDHHILDPLIKKGLDGIEVYYPYDPSHRKQSIERYYRIAQEHHLLVSGGTDFHGDGRIALGEVKLNIDHALRIINHNVG